MDVTLSVSDRKDGIEMDFHQFISFAISKVSLNHLFIAVGIVVS